jgi:NTE family protein
MRKEGTKVHVLCPGPEDLEVIGANLMDPSRRVEVLETSLRTVSATLAAEQEPQPEAAAPPRSGVH